MKNLQPIGHYVGTFCVGPSVELRHLELAGNSRSQSFPIPCWRRCRALPKQASKFPHPVFISQRFPANGIGARAQSPQMHKPSAFYCSQKPHGTRPNQAHLSSLAVGFAGIGRVLFPFEDQGLFLVSRALIGWVCADRRPVTASRTGLRPKGSAADFISTYGDSKFHHTQPHTRAQQMHRNMQHLLSV